MRLDQRLVILGLAPSRNRAQALIKAGVVEIDGRIATRASEAVKENMAITVTHNPIPWVSRAALKLVHGLNQFDLSPKGALALDCGASTGGFTEVLLAYGAAHVYAVDVGHDQLAPSLANNSKVTALCGFNIRNISAKDISYTPNFITADLSFISLTKALPAVLTLAAPQAMLVALIKPQFEVGREFIGKGGLVKDKTARNQAVETVKAFLKQAGWMPSDAIDSPISGSNGNHEFLIFAQKIRAY